MTKGKAPEMPTRAYHKPRLCGKWYGLPLRCHECKKLIEQPRVECRHAKMKRVSDRELTDEPLGISII